MEVHGNIIEVTYLVNIVGDDSKPIKKNVKAKMSIDIDDIRIVDYCHDKLGNLVNNKCKIYHHDIGWVMITESYKSINDLLITDHFTISGFQTKKERKKTIKNLNKYGYNNSRSS